MKRIPYCHTQVSSHQDYVFVDAQIIEYLSMSTVVYHCPVLFNFRSIIKFPSYRWRSPHCINFLSHCISRSFPQLLIFFSVHTCLYTMPHSYRILQFRDTAPSSNDTPIPSRKDKSHRRVSEIVTLLFHVLQRFSNRYLLRFCSRMPWLWTC